MTDATESHQEGKRRASASQDTELKVASEASAQNATGAEVSQPRAPETEKVRSIREQYLAFAKVVLGDSALSYLSLYQRYTSDRPDVQQAVQALDQALAQSPCKQAMLPVS